MEIIAVSLFTREWIEILLQQLPETAVRSPSLRGSGLKLLSPQSFCICLRLPLYEGVD